MANVAVVGAQWGDEGKGKIVDWLSNRADMVVRFQGGHNAGHTLVVDGKVYKLALLPSGVVQGKPSIIGNGVVVDPWHLVGEIEKIEAQGVAISPDILTIADNACLILPIHPALDVAREAAASAPGAKIGTTGRGIGPAYEALLASLLEIAPKILPYVKPAWRVLDQAQKDGKRVLFEGAQGAFLDVDHGTYPYVTSSNTVAGQAAAGSGVGPRGVGYVLGIVKAYTTRVGEGPFACELDDEVGQHLATVGREVGVNTGRARRCGWFDAVLVRQSVAINGIDGIALTKLDVLDGLKTLKICVGYKVDGEVLDYLPSSLKAQAAAEPVFEELEGWSESTAGVRSFKDINANAIKYVRRIEELIGAPVALLSTSPERDDTILMRDPFQG